MAAGPLSKPADMRISFDTRASAADEPESVSRAHRDIFGPGANPKKRYVTTYKDIREYSSSLKKLGLKVVYTAGVWDLPHIGHCRYLQKAKDNGDVLIVGVELDEAVKIRKGPNRPVVPYSERVEMLCHIRPVDLIVPVPDYDERGLSGTKMLQAIQPDVFIATRRSFPEASDTAEWLERIKEYCTEVKILESQAETSTSNKIRDMVLGVGALLKEGLGEARQAVTAALTSTWEDLEKRVDEAMGRMQ